MFNKSVKQLVGNCLCLCLYMSVGWKLHLLMVKLDREANVYMSDIFTTTKVVSSPWVPNELDFKPTWIISVSLLKIIVCVATISFKTISICRVWKVSLSFSLNLRKLTAGLIISYGRKHELTHHRQMNEGVKFLRELWYCIGERWGWGVDIVNWPLKRVLKLTFRASALRQSE